MCNHLNFIFFIQHYISKMCLHPIVVHSFSQSYNLFCDFSKIFPSISAYIVYDWQLYLPFFERLIFTKRLRSAEIKKFWLLRP